MMEQSLEKATLGKRILAIIYDLLIIFFITLIVTLIVQQLIIQLGLITLEEVQITKEGEKVSVIPANSLVTPFLKSLWLLVSFFYFGHYWTKRGHTLGMKAWKITAVSDNNSPLTWAQATKRYVFSLFGLGLFWIFFDKNKRALQDKMSNSTLKKLA